MKKRGISLIVLIITIVVILILATAIILNMTRTNMIEKSNEAVVKQDFKTFQEELDLYIADEYIDKKGKLDITTIDATTKDEVLAIISSIKDTKYQEYVTIVDGKIVISDSMIEKEREWAKEVIILGNTATPVFKSDETLAEKNSTFTGENFASTNPVIPAGFKILSKKNDEKTVEWSDNNNDGIVDNWNDGLAIVDGDGNEFVWVPVDGVNINYAKKFDEYPKLAAITKVDDVENALPMKDETTRVSETEQIIKYGGFYIGRYEAGIPANQNVITGAAGVSNVNGIPVIKKGVNVWTCISYNVANVNAQRIYENSPSVRSGLLTGTGWDTACEWIHSEKDAEGNSINNVISSVKWGNHTNTDGNARYDVDGKTTICGYKQVTGKSEYWKAKNIYDFAGNAWEITGESFATSNILIRGGGYDNKGADSSAAYRWNVGMDFGNLNIGFRIVLYVL